MASFFSVPVTTRLRTWFCHSVLAVIFAVVAPYSPAETIEIKQMAEILPPITDDTLVVFDIDNTLMEPIGNLGSDQWYYFLVRRIEQSEKVTPAEAIDRAMVRWNAVQPQLTMRPVEPTTPALVRELQKRKIKTLGLTARTSDIADVTLTHLKNIGIELGKSAAHPDNFKFKQADGVVYTNGVIFVGEHNNKGECLRIFLEKTALRPKQIFFVDDHRKHVNAMDLAFRKSPIPIVCFRYGAADEKVNLFKNDTADIELYLNGTSGGNVISFPAQAEVSAQANK